MKHDWKKYQKLSKSKPPAPLLKEALGFVKGKRALDMGSGALQDSEFLLEKGFRVLAVDLIQPPKTLNNKNFIFKQGRFEDIFPKKKQFNLINAQFSLPYNGNSKKELKKLWLSMTESLVRGGVFVGQLFGTKDGWYKQEEFKDVIFLNRNEITALLRGYKVIHFAEVEKEGRVVGSSRLKHWHYFNIISKKI